MPDSQSVVERPKHRNQHPPAVTKAKQAEYLKALIKTCSHRNACKAANCAENMPFQWAQKNEDFRKRLEESRVKAEGILLSRYEDSLDSTVLQSETIEDVAKLQILRMFRMKRLDPRYRDNAVVSVNAVGPVAIQLNFGVSTPQPLVVDGHLEKNNLIENDRRIAKSRG